MEISYLFALTTGFLGGFGHCIGMCGPIVATYTLQHSTFNIQHSTLRKILPHLLYNTGRITTYVFIGGMMGLTGSFVNVAGNLTGIQNVAAILAGLLMIITGIAILGISSSINFLEKHNTVILKAIKTVVSERTVWRYYLIGLLMGFLPCGLSYSVFIASAGSGGLFSGMAILFLFGMGTIPSLLLFGVLTAYLSQRIRGIVYRLSGVVVILMGAFFVVKGFKTI